MAAVQAANRLLRSQDGAVRRLTERCPAEEAGRGRASTSSEDRGELKQAAVEQLSQAMWITIWAAEAGRRQGPRRLDEGRTRPLGTREQQRRGAPRGLFGHPGEGGKSSPGDGNPFDSFYVELQNQRLEIEYAGGSVSDEKFGRKLAQSGT